MKKRLIFAGSLVFIFIIGGLVVSRFLPYIKAYLYYAKFDSVQQIEAEENMASQLTDVDFLHVSGCDIVNEENKQIFLQGVNLGGWLLQEYWMCPVAGNPEITGWTYTETLNVLEERFGTEKTQELVELYEQNWISEWDIQNIASMGCNVIRLPFWYRNFMSDANGTWIAENPDENPGFQKLDWLIETAGKYGVYVILDMHGCPGGQSYDHCTGSPRTCELFVNEIYQQAMEKLWIAIADRYKDNPVVAAYDIMNEALAFEGEIEDDPRNILYDRMIKAIRQVDDRHIIAVEGIWTLSVLPDPKEWGWDNVMYEVHTYGETDVETYCRNLQSYSAEKQVPVYIGEFSDFKILEYCRNLGIHCTSWTYKGTTYAEGDWYMYYSDRSAADVYNDPFWLIKMKWGNCLRTQFLDEKTQVTAYWK